MKRKEGGGVERRGVGENQGGEKAAGGRRDKGARYGTDDVERTSRPDVQRQFGLAEPTCGFIATIAVPGVAHPRELGADLQVLGGDAVETAYTPLRMAAAVTALLQKTS